LEEYENKALGSKREDVMGCWRKLRNEETLNLYSSKNIIRLIKSRKMRWAGICSTQEGHKKYAQNLSEKLKERHHSADPGVDGRIILKRILKKASGCRMDSIDSG
jgi:hypothetical protein